MTRLPRKGLAKIPVRRHIQEMKRPFVFALILALGACERATTDPSVPAEAGGMQPGKANTLPVLFGNALLKTQRQLGAEAVGELMAEWEARQAEVRAAHTTGDRNAVQSKLQALHNEEIRIILKVFGPEVVKQVIYESYMELGAARIRIDEAERGGAHTASAAATSRQIQNMLDRATVLSNRQPARALAMATQAAALLAAIDDSIIELRRVRGIETLFPAAAAKLSPRELAAHAQLEKEAQRALRDGQRSVAGEKLAALRAEEIRLVLDVMGRHTATRVLRDVHAVLRDMRTRIDALKREGADVSRLERMLNSATDMYNRGDRADREGDAATALDLGSHAAGLLNSLRHLTAK